MELKQKVIIVVVYTAAAVAVGRYLSPEKVVIKKEVVREEVERKEEKTTKDTDIDRNRKIKKTVVETIKPDGTRTIKTRYTNDTETKKSVKEDKKTTDVSKKTETDKESKEVSNGGGGKLNLSALAAVNVTDVKSGLSYGLSVNKELLGPFTLGIFGLSSGTGGVSLGVNF